MNNTFITDLKAGTYTLRAICGDLLSGANNTSKFTITNATTGDVFLSNISVSSAGGAHFRDYVYTAGGEAYTFSMDLPVGTYYIYMYTGDKFADNTTKFYFGDNCEVVSSNNAAVSEKDGKTVYTQTSNGEIVALRRGTSYVYVYNNGALDKIKVVVR